MSIEIVLGLRRERTEVALRPVRRISVGGVHQELGSYSHLVEGGNGTFYVSGQVPVDADGRFIGSEDVAVQTRRAFENLLGVLGSVQLGVDDIARLTTYLVDAGDARALGSARDEILGTSLPASTVVIVAGLLDNRWKLEVDAIAVRRDRPTGACRGGMPWARVLQI